jgi:DNA-binding transcriptional ArsR family regulator
MEEQNKEVSKEVSKSTRGGISDLFILQCLKKGLRPSQISSQFSLNKKTLQYHLTSLKDAGAIKKIGYGVWEVNVEKVLKEVSKSTRVAKQQPGFNSDFFKPDSVRGHAFVFKFELPKNLRNWERREELLQKAGILFKPLRIFGSGQQIIFKTRKVWLTNKSIIIYEPESFIANLAKEAKSQALSHIVELLKGLERHLQANFEIHKSRFKVSRQHYALIKNALARQYNQEGKKLECFYPGEGFWFLIDNSYNLHEAETIHPESAVQDNEKVQNFFNGLKSMDGFTPQFVVNSLATQTQNLDHYAIHLRAHVESVQKLGTAVEDLTKVVKEIRGIKP